MAKYVSASKAAALLGLNEKTVRNLIERGEIQAYHVSAKRFNVSMDEVHRIAAKRGIELEQDTEVSIAALDLEMFKLRDRIEQLEQLRERVEQLEQRSERAEKPIAPRAPATSPTTMKEKRQHATTPTASQGTLPDELPAGSLRFQTFLEQHGLKPHRRKIANYLDTPSHGLQCVRLPGRTPNESERWLTPEQQEALLAWLQVHHPELIGD